jgi:NADH-quinone oxidoreductase subunit N
MTTLLINLWPELTLCGTACILLVLGALGGAAGRRLAAPLSLLALGIVFLATICAYTSPVDDQNFTNSLGGGQVAKFYHVLTAGAGLLFVLLAWPTKSSGEIPGGNNGAVAFGTESAEYFALMLLSLAGLMTSASANNFILLFLGLELASIPTYIMVSISRPVPMAQEAGVKYFFLGALSAALMLLGFSYLYGATGTIYLEGNGLTHPGLLEVFNATHGADGAVPLTSMEVLGVILLLAGFGFKMAAFPLHVYAADVYQGAASPMTAMLSVVPKAAGLVALVKVLLSISATAPMPHNVVVLVAVLAALTMSVGNLLALRQLNVKRVMAYSSVAHSGYLLAGVAAMLALGKPGGAGRAAVTEALGAVLFYIAMYAVMNTGVFAVLQQIPARRRYADQTPVAALEARGVASAETYEDLAGHGRSHPLLAVVMAVCCLSLVGLPATGGFLGKLLLAKALLNSGMVWLLVVMMINAAVSAVYYLRMPGNLMFRSVPTTGGNESGGGVGGRSSLVAWPATLAGVVCGLGVLVLGIVLPLSSALSNATSTAAESLVERKVPAGEVQQATGTLERGGGGAVKVTPKSSL